MKTSSIASKTLCQRYHDAMSKKVQIQKPMTEVSYASFYLYFANSNLVGKKRNTYEKLAEIIKKSDFEFKHLTPLKKAVTVWRGINNPKDGITLNRYKKVLNAKIGDVIYMPEYAYASDKFERAKVYASNDGLIFKIKVPKGAKLSHDEDYVFPRASKFVCTSNFLVKDGKQNYRIIGLDYILPTKRQQKTDIMTKIRNKITQIFDLSVNKINTVK